jgi:EAL domain-containing protein (putative c-di-GMP-specific phosphodiesterase class I)
MHDADVAVYAAKQPGKDNWVRCHHGMEQPVLTHARLGGELGRFVLREACRQAASWLAEYGPDALQKAGPNVSRRQLADPDFVDDVRRAGRDRPARGPARFPASIIKLDESFVDGIELDEPGTRPGPARPMSAERLGELFAAQLAAAPHAVA